MQEQFQKSFEAVIDNMLNPNTSYRNSREIVIKLKFTQNEARDDVHCAVSCSEKLAPQSPMETAFSIGTDLRTGEKYVEEYGKHVRGQVTIDEVIEETVDEDTGEIKVIDLRNAK